VRLVVSAAAGGPSDVIGRIMAQYLSESMGQQFYVDNIPAGAGNVAVGIVAKAAPDGYTILTPTSAVVVNPSLYSNLPYDTLRDFVPVTLVAAAPHVLTVTPSLPAHSVQELIALVRANPGKFSYASPGTGTTGQLAGELFRLSLGLDLIHVPFNGAAPATLSTIGGHTPIMFSALPGAAPNIKDGKLRALAVTSARRDPEFPDVPTLAEAGVPDRRQAVPRDRPHGGAAGGEAAPGCDRLYAGCQHARGVRGRDQGRGGAVGQGDPRRAYSEDRMRANADR
jgi:tripartite-type tricarboxylate transporter receptor subunit TctC